jgi:hypothetical protein
MASGHGGARVGSGRKPKPLAEKILTKGNGHHTVKRLKEPKLKDLADELDEDIAKIEKHPITELLESKFKDTAAKVVPIIYAKTVKFLEERGCLQFVNTDLIARYALFTAHWVRCEEGIHTYGPLGKHPTTGAPTASPYVLMLLSFSKQTDALWGQINQIVKENCVEPYAATAPHDDVMARLLKEG